MIEGESIAWSRETAWRQGAVLPLEAVRAADLVEIGNCATTCVVVISHDCDLASIDLQNEPDVEVIIGRHLDTKGDGNYFWAKSPKTLHLEVSRDGVPVIIEIRQIAKKLVPKVLLAPFRPDNRYLLPLKSLRVLRSWLACRYDRTPFPDDLVEKLSTSGVDKKLVKAIKPTAELLSAVYFDIAEGGEANLAQGMPCTLNIILLYPSGNDPLKTAEKAQSLTNVIENIFADAFFDVTNDTWRDIHLTDCIAVSEDDMPVAKEKSLTQWRYDDMTLRGESQSV